MTESLLFALEKIKGAREDLGAWLDGSTLQASRA